MKCRHALLDVSATEDVVFFLVLVDPAAAIAGLTCCFEIERLKTRSIRDLIMRDVRKLEVQRPIRMH